MNSESQKWFLVYTKAREEARAKKNLEIQGFSTFLPMIGYEKTSDPESFLLKPMFPRYLFVSLDEKKGSWSKIQSTRGVSHLVIFGERPTPVPNLVITYLKTKVDNQDIVTQKLTSGAFLKGEELTIKDGIFKGQEATFLYETSKNRVKILLNLMNKLIITEVPEHDIGQKITIEAFKL